MMTNSASDLELMDQALLRLRHFFDAPAILTDTGTRVELSTLLVLEAVARSGSSASVREIADQLDVAHSTASRLVTRAENAGMIARATSTTDRRETVIETTAVGHDFRRRASAYRLDRLVALTSGWTQDERATFASFLDRFSAAV
ncbi:MarR family winged helix-turn-helix transcriptional regulator [Pengzhenrongella frigida]|nr:MarR family transcriptional regulator [Cellulomonas sp. HLT2-17]